MLFARALLACHREQFGTEARSAFVVTLRGRYDLEVTEMLEDLRTLGVDAVTVDARSVRRSAGAVVDDRGRRADLVYASLDQLDLIHDPDLTTYFDAMTSGNAYFVNPLLSQCIIGDKRALSVMADPVFGDHFDSAERNFIERHVPWTRLVDSTDTKLLETLDADREGFVLKPANRLCGEGVVVGPATTQSDWRTALSAAAAAGTYLAQKYCPMPALGGDPHRGASSR
ncbi:hypothetical protein AB0L82_35685 [Nocardia sp. NPDC052001]|uniref:hypothetical protein n=1 Tax=Nocardia sp. NPDC052001 TaxID=3154853 RepID=UPI0034364E0F